MGLFLGFLSCSIDPYVCFCASMILFWLMLLGSIVWSQGVLFLQLCFFLKITLPFQGSPGGSVIKNLPVNAGDTGSILDPGRSHIPQGN